MSTSTSVQQAGHRQYQVSDGSYSPCGQTQPTVPPGFYDVMRTMQGPALRRRETVSDDLIDIPGTVADEIFADMSSFIESRHEYMRYGLTHKRGYLFYGPPGSGKTSLGLMLAKRFVERVGGVVMYAGDYQQFTGGVSIMRDVEPGRPSMYLIEEADEIADYTECLSILDGELSIHGAVFVAMTNYHEKLPPRLINRPGRFDRVTLVDCPPAAVQVEYLRRVEARVGENPGIPARIVAALAGIPVSMAHLREAFISHVLMRMSLDEVRARFEMMAGAGKKAKKKGVAAKDAVIDSPDVGLDEGDGDDDDSDDDGDCDCPCEHCPGH